MGDVRPPLILEGSMKIFDNDYVCGSFCVEFVVRNFGGTSGSVCRTEFKNTKLCVEVINQISTLGTYNIRDVLTAGCKLT